VTPPIGDFATNNIPGSPITVFDLSSIISAAGIVAGEFYSITLQNLFIALAQNPYNTPSPTYVPPGVSILHYLVCGDSTNPGANTVTYFPSFCPQPNQLSVPINTINPEDYYLSLTGTLVTPITGTIDTLLLNAYVQSAGGVSGTGYWTYPVPPESGANRITVTQLLA
jgi:hypothetical protein